MDPDARSWWGFFALGVGILAAFLITLFVAVGYSHAFHRDAQRTERARIEACRTVEDQALRTLCINVKTVKP